MKSLSYRHTAYPSAWLTAAVGFLYSATFVFAPRPTPALAAGLTATFLLLGGIFAASALLGLHERLVPSAGGYATWALLFGLAGALSATMHGGYDLANAINAPSQASSGLPSAVDPRGLGTFGLAGLSILAFAYLMGRDAAFPLNLSYLGFISGALLIVIYLARLIILSTSNPFVLSVAALEGFAVNPAWYLWLGLTLRRAT